MADFLTKLAQAEKIEYQSRSLKLSSVYYFAATFAANEGNPNTVNYNIEIDGSSLQENIISNFSVVKGGFYAQYFQIKKENPSNQVKITLTPQVNVLLVSLGLSETGN